MARCLNGFYEDRPIITARQTGREERVIERLERRIDLLEERINKLEQSNKIPFKFLKEEKELEVDNHRDYEGLYTFDMF